MPISLIIFYDLDSVPLIYFTEVWTGFKVSFLLSHCCHYWDLRRWQPNISINLPSHPMWYHTIIWRKTAMGEVYLWERERERVPNEKKNFHLLVLNSSPTWVLFTLWEPFWLNWLVPPRRHIIYPRLTSLFLTFSGFPSFSLLLYRKQALSLPCFSLCCFVTNPSTSISVFSIIQSNGHWRYESPEENESKDSTEKRKHKRQDFWDLGEESNGGSISSRAGKKERRWHRKLRVESVDKPSLCRRFQWEVSDLWPGWWCLNTNN